MTIINTQLFLIVTAILSLPYHHYHIIIIISSLSYHRYHIIVIISSLSYHYYRDRGLRIIDHLKIKNIIYDILRDKNELCICAREWIDLSPYCKHMK